MKQMKEENTKVRMQLRDPGNIKRGNAVDTPFVNVDEFDRVQSQFDMLAL